MNNIRVLSNILKTFFVVGLIVNLAMYTLHWLLSPGEVLNFFGGNFSISIDSVNFPEALKSKAWFWDALISLPSLLLTSLLFFCLFKLFSNYSKYEFFSKNNSRLINRVGLFLILRVVWEFISVPLLSFIVLDDVEMLTLNFTRVPFFDLITGLTVLCIGWILKKASDLQEQQSLTI